MREDVAKNISKCEVSAKLDSWAKLAGDGEKADTALKNLEGGDKAVGLATRWATADGKGLKKLQRIQEHLPESLRILLGEGISKAEAKVQTLAEERLREESQARSEQSMETEEDFYDDRGNTAHRIFAGSSFIRSGSSSSAPVEGDTGFCSLVSSPRKTQNYSRPVTASPTPAPTVFNQEYANWFEPITPPKQRLKPLPKTPEPNKMMNVLSPSTNKANTVHKFTASKLHLATTPNPAPHTNFPPDFAPTPSSASTSTAPALSSSSTKRSSKSPLSVNTVARRDRRRAERGERRRIALKLGRARPDLVSKEFTEKFLGPVQEESC